MFNQIKFTIMKQKVLTEKQKEILGRLERILEEAKENGIGLIYDTADETLTAYNAENVEDCYATYCSPWGENEKKFDWDSASIVENFYADCCNTNIEDVHVAFK